MSRRALVACLSLFACGEPAVPVKSADLSVNLTPKPMQGEYMVRVGGNDVWVTATAAEPNATVHVRVEEPVYVDRANFVLEPAPMSHFNIGSNFNGRGELKPNEKVVHANSPHRTLMFHVCARAEVDGKFGEESCVLACVRD